MTEVDVSRGYLETVGDISGSFALSVTSVPVGFSFIKRLVLTGTCHRSVGLGDIDTLKRCYVGCYVCINTEYTLPVGLYNQSTVFNSKR